MKKLKVFLGDIACAIGFHSWEMLWSNHQGGKTWECRRCKCRSYRVDPT